MHACAIAARHQLAPARVLAESFAAFHPGRPFTVLVVDGEPGERYGEDPPYRARCPTEVGIAADELRRLALIHDLPELRAALAPRLLRHLLDEAHGDQDVVVLLDPDTVVLGALDDIEPLARAHGTVLVPHVLAPVPEDGYTPDGATVAAAGVFNPGLVGAGPSAGELLDWWEGHAARHATGDAAAGMPAGGRGLDTAPAWFEPAVWRDPGVGAGYWNLHERPLTRAADGRLLAGGSPLRTLQLSGYDPDRPHLLSAGLGATPRVRLSGEPLLFELTAGHGDRLRAAGDAGRRALPYRYGSIAGTPVPGHVRSLAREVLLGSDPAKLPSLPFGPGGDAGFVRWLNEPVARRGDTVLTRLVLNLWHHRADLQAAFPHPTFADLDGLAAWATTAADFHEHYRGLHAPPAARPAPPAEPGSADAPPGLNIVGYLRAELGVGEAGRLMALAADAAGVPHQTIATGDTPSRQLDPFVTSSTASAPPVPYRVSLLCVNADRTPYLLAELPDDVLAGRYRIGLWFWELSQAPPEAAGALDLVDEVWVTSEFVAGALRPLTTKPVLVAPLAIAAPVPTHLTRPDLGLPEDRCVFLTTFDAFSIPARKNPVGAVRAYTAAFGPDDGAHLVVKATNGARHPASLEQLWHLTRDRPDIEVRDGYLSRAEMSALVQLSDACVSLHRSEGFGLVPAAAMAAGRPVIATAYSGTLAFMDDDSARLVPYDLVPVGPGNAPYPPGATWAEPDLDVATKHLRWIVDEPDAARRLGARARAAVARTHGIDVAGRWIDRRLAEILGTAPDPRRSA